MRARRLRLPTAVSGRPVASTEDMPAGRGGRWQTAHKCAPPPGGLAGAHRCTPRAVGGSGGRSELDADDAELLDLDGGVAFHAVVPRWRPTVGGCWQPGIRSAPPSATCGSGWNAGSESFRCGQRKCRCTSNEPSDLSDDRMRIKIDLRPRRDHCPGPSHPSVSALATGIATEAQAEPAGPRHLNLPLTTSTRRLAPSRVVR